MTRPTDEELDALVGRLHGTPLYEGHGEASETPERAADAITALRTQLATLQLHLDSTNDKLEIERTLTDGAHRRAREAEAEAHACGAEREAWKTRAEAALAAQIEEACAVIDAHAEYDQAFCCDGRECGCQGESVHDVMKQYIRQPHDRTALDRMLAEHEVRLREARENALREAAEICSSIRQRIANGPMPEGARFDYEQSILALIEAPNAQP